MYIADLEKRLGGRVLIMDIFGDLYEFCLLMLELDRDDIVVEIINKIEEPIKKTRIANIKRKYLELKIRLYRRNNCEQKCIEAMNSFFDLSVQLEKDKQKMIATMLRVRNSLDTIKERQKQLELETQRLSEKQRQTSSRELPTGTACRDLHRRRLKGAGLSTYLCRMRYWI